MAYSTCERLGTSAPVRPNGQSPAKPKRTQNLSIQFGVWANRQPRASMYTAYSRTRAPRASCWPAGQPTLRRRRLQVRVQRVQLGTAALVGFNLPVGVRPATPTGLCLQLGRARVSRIEEPERQLRRRRWRWRRPCRAQNDAKGGPQMALSLSKVSSSRPPPRAL